MANEKPERRLSSSPGKARGSKGLYIHRKRERGNETGRKSGVRPIGAKGSAKQTTERGVRTKKILIIRPKRGRKTGSSRGMTEQLRRVSKKNAGKWTKALARRQQNGAKKKGGSVAEPKIINTMKKKESPKAGKKAKVVIY